jgi:hypothetical protein
VSKTDNLVEEAWPKEVKPDTVKDDNDPAPAVKALAPILIAPKEPPIEPAAKTPTEVKEEPVTLAPRVVESKILALLMRKALPVAKLTLPVVKVKPPAKEEVVLLPEIVVVVVPPT